MDECQSDSTLGTTRRVNVTQNSAGEDPEMPNQVVWKTWNWQRIVAAMMCLLALLVCFSPVALAQDDEAPQEEDVASAATQDVQINYLTWTARSLGWFFGLVFLGLSFVLVALIIMNLLTARRENVVPSELVSGFEQHLDAQQFQEAYELVRSDQSFLGQVLTAGLAKASSAGYPQAIEAMQEVGEEENMRLEHRLSYLALIGTLSPMIGLLGTVYGMIDSFKLIANTDSGSPNPQDLAEGISTALFTTMVGLSLAIPALAAYNLLRNRVARLVLEVGIVSEGLMSRFQKKPE